MNNQELLQRARDAFTKIYGCEPEKHGLTAISIYEQTVMFAKSQEVIKAYTDAQELLKERTDFFCGFGLLIIGFIFASLHEDYPISLFFNVSIFLFLAAIICINYQSTQKEEKLKAIYTKKDSIIFYKDGTLSELTS